jgi:hypothetical protein
MSSPEKRKQTAMVGETTSHNPSFVTKVPWYLGATDEKKEESLDHQKNWKPAPSSSLAAQEATPSSNSSESSLVCDNCGNRGHDRKSCLERPRKVLAKFTEEEEEVVPPPNATAGSHLISGFEAKRDRWEGFEAKDYDKVVDEFSRNEIRSKIFTKDTRKQIFQADETVANLRMRTDTAKYLYNLDVNSAYYDPKSRSMRDDPRNAAAGEFKGDNFVRFTGDAEESMKVRQFAWESAQKGETKIHEIANPTESVVIMKRLESSEKQKISAEKRAILEKYGALSSDSD